MVATGLAIFFALLIPGALVLLSLVTRSLTDRAPNRWVGYRTDRAMADQQSWSLSQRLCARMLMQMGAPMLLITIGVVVILARSGVEDEDIWYSIGLWQAIALLPGFGWMLVRIERRLKRAASDA